MLFIRNKAETPEEPFKWGPDEEAEFKQRQSKALALFRKLYGSPVCHNVGISRFIQTMVYKNRASELRVRTVLTDLGVSDLETL